MLSRKYIIGAIIFFLLAINAQSKQQTFRVFFKDKGGEKFEQGSDLYNKTISLLSERALKRRRKVRTKENLITIEDAPIEQNYINKILELNVKLRLSLRWRNYCVFECDSAKYNAIAEEISDFDFVQKVQTTGEYIYQVQTISEPKKEKRVFNKKNLYTITNQNDCGSFHYGDSYLQNSIINADKLHRLGITGDSVIIGILDAGFRWRTHDAMKNANVIAEYDFIQLDDNTSNEKDDIDSQDGHGTLTFSTICGMLPDSLIGVSPTSSFVLCKTESIPYEIRLEEDNYAAAIEWLEAIGADITSSSLAYIAFDKGDSSYVYDDLDGKSTITSIALNNAVARGMVCVTAAANKGPKPRTLYTPGDADSAITCAAVKIDNNMIVPAGFSSRGPTANNRIKPDIAALGVKVVSAGRKSSKDLIRANGTSLSTPLIAGASSLLLSSFPELKSWEVRSLLYSTASNYPKKDNITGYGLLDIFAAMHKAGTIISPPVIYSVNDYIRILFHIVPDSYFSENPILTVISGEQSKKYTMYASGKKYQYAADIKKSDIIGGEAKARLNVNTKTSLRQYPFRTKYFTFNTATERIPCGIDKNKLPALKAKKNLFIEPTIVEANTSNINLTYELSKNGSVNISIYSMEGRRLYEDTISERQPGIITKEISLRAYYSGTYFIVVSGGGNTDVEKILVIR